MAKKSTKKTTAKKTTKKAATEKKPPTKSQLFGDLAERTGLQKKQVSQVFDELQDIIGKNLSGRNAPGQFTLPGLAKMTVKKKPATKQRKGRNPFTGEEITIAAKPASKTVKVRPLKNLKELVS